MNTLPSRLREVMDELGIEKPRELAEFCGVSEGLVSQWFSGTTKLGPKPLRALARTHFNLDWIVEGRLPKYRIGPHRTSGGGIDHVATPSPQVRNELEKLSHGEADLLLVYRLAADADKTFLLGVADAIRRRMIVEGTWEGPKLAASS